MQTKSMPTSSNLSSPSSDSKITGPQKALAAGVLRQAGADLRRFRNTRDSTGREMYADAESWLRANDTDWPYSFINVCEVLGLSSEFVRDEILSDAASSWYSHSKLVARELARSVKASVSTVFAGRHSFAASKF